jgi:hypothetical protein
VRLARGVEAGRQRRRGGRRLLDLRGGRGTTEDAREVRVRLLLTFLRGAEADAASVVHGLSAFLLPGGEGFAAG